MGQAKLTPQVAALCEAAMAAMAADEHRLVDVEPIILDLSIREPAVGIAQGHTVQDKLQLFELSRRAGFTDILLAAFNVADLAVGSFDDVVQVDDLFCQALLDQGEDLTGTFAFTSPGWLDSSFVPHPSMLKQAGFRIPNAIVDLTLAPWNRRRHGRVASETDYLNDVLATVDWLTDPINLIGDHGGVPRIYLNFQDGVDAFLDDWTVVARFSAALGAHRHVSALTFEDGKGTAMPFQIGALTRVVKAAAPKTLVLAHMHGGSGMENANMIEAMLAGADGIWAGFVREAATIGHAPSSEFLANLARLGNPHIESYRLDELVPLAREMSEINTRSTTDPQVPIVGTDAYRTMLTFFMQDKGRAMDLAPERIGAEPGWRIAPVASDNLVVRGRLLEIDPSLSDSLDDDVITRMRALMRIDLANGIRLTYDEPETLLALYRRAMNEQTTAEREPNLPLHGES